MTTIAVSARSLMISAAEVGPARNFRRGDVVFYQNEEATRLYFVESGLVKLTRTNQNGRRQIVSVSGANQLAGEECLSGSEPVAYRSEAECLTDLTAYEIPVATMLRLYGIPDFAASIVGYAIRRDVEFIHRADLLVGFDVSQRILYGLAALARLVQPNADGTGYPVPMTQAEIGSYVGATRETISATLSALQRRSLVRLSRRLVTTVHPDTLIAAAEGQLTHSHFP